MFFFKIIIIISHLSCQNNNNNNNNKKRQIKKVVVGKAIGGLEGKFGMLINLTVWVHFWRLFSPKHILFENKMSKVIKN